MSHYHKLQQVLDQIDSLRGKNAIDVDFLVWKEAALEAIRKVFTSSSHEFISFQNLRFSMSSIQDLFQVKGTYYRDLTLAKEALQRYIQDLSGGEVVESERIAVPDADRVTQITISKKVFISHASIDKEIVSEIIQILKLIGLRHDQIICTSFPEYGIPLGVNYLNWLKDEITDNTLVIFVLSKNFYKSPVCLSEMGAVWVLAKDHIPMLIPPFTYDDVRGVFPQTQGMFVNERRNFNELAELVERVFGLSTGRAGDWESNRDKIIARIDLLINSFIQLDSASSNG